MTCSNLKILPWCLVHTDCYCASDHPHNLPLFTLCSVHFAWEIVSRATFSRTIRHCQLKRWHNSRSGKEGNLSYVLQFQDNRLIPSMGKFILNFFSPHPTPPQNSISHLDFPKSSLKSSLFEILGLGDTVFYFFFEKEVDYKLVKGFHPWTCSERVIDISYAFWHWKNKSGDNFMEKMLSVENAIGEWVWSVWF